MEAKERILKTLKSAEKPLKSGEIAELTQLDKTEVDKVIKLLKHEELIDSPKRCFYSLK
ncbi:MAG: MarR family transcriptional regulator [Bacteroidetes bacterium]|jgi:transcription initiation factor IIE alpha subunit|nr:MarR family transcriptional regulator [Bacteroidota bacterium]